MNILKKIYSCCYFLNEIITINKSRKILTNHQNVLKAHRKHILKLVFSDLIFWAERVLQPLYIVPPFQFFFSNQFRLFSRFLLHQNFGTEMIKYLVNKLKAFKVYHLYSKRVPNIVIISYFNLLTN